VGALHLVFGPQGAGKSTYSRSLAKQLNGTVFSIDEWMARLYGPDLPKPLNFIWIMERVKRCEIQIWITAREVAKNGGNVVLDLGFMKVRTRAEFSALAKQAGIPINSHFVTAPHAVRRNRVLSRNTEKGETFSFEVTPAMFDFMEKEFEAPGEAELARSTVFNVHAAA
jgi:predicted kinase